MSASSKPTPIALPNEMVSDIADCAKALGESQQYAIRLAIKIGLVHLRHINYDLATAVFDHSQLLQRGVIVVPHHGAHSAAPGLNEEQSARHTGPAEIALPPRQVSYKAPARKGKAAASKDAVGEFNKFSAEIGAGVQMKPKESKKEKRAED